MIQVDSVRSGASDPSRFQFTGGLLERSHYLERAADKALPEALLAGHYCHILAPRQIGKTSLCFRTARKLQKRGVRCALVDVTAAGTASTAEDWYFGIVQDLARRLRLPDPLDQWQQRAGVAPGQRFRDYVRELVEGAPDAPPLVIFLDEIEGVRVSPVDVDDFFLILRSFHEERGQNPALQKLRFCLIGVTTPNDLIRNKSVTPFNVSRPIRVEDFTRRECDGLYAGLEGLGGSEEALIDAVFGYTDGHPYMTMRACCELLRRGQVQAGKEQEAVDAMVRETFLDRPLEDANMNYAARRFEEPRFERDGARLADKIQLYRRVLTGQDPPAHNESDVQMELRICGMVKDVEAAPGKRVLRPRNRIYAAALDAEWLRSKGDRRFFAEAVWKWLDAGKSDDVLLRGQVLENARAWAATNALSEDEQAFLDASRRHQTEEMEAQHARVTLEVNRAELAQKEAEQRLEKAQAELATARAEKAAAEAEAVALAAQQESLKRSLRKTSRYMWGAVLVTGLSVALSGVVVWRTGLELKAQQASEAMARDAQSRLTEEARQKEQELRRLSEDLKKLDEQKATAAQTLAQAEQRAAEVDTYIEKNKDLKERATKAEDRAQTAEAKLAQAEARASQAETTVNQLRATVAGDIPERPRNQK